MTGAQSMSRKQDSYPDNWTEQNVKKEEEESVESQKKSESGVERKCSFWGEK